MNKQHLLLQWSICFLAFLTSSLSLSAQLEVSVNQADAIYNVGETAFFQAKATYSGSATYEIIYDNQAPVIESGTINLNGNQTTAIPYRANEPGVAICRVNFNGVVREASAAFAPLDISPLEEEPSDFDSFWQSQKNLKNSLPMDMQMSYSSETSYQTTYTFSIANIEGRRTYGYISVPKGSGPFPASITLPPYGTSSSVVGADTESAEKGGMIAVSISIHNRPVNQDDPNAYKPDDNTDKSKFYYRYGLVGAMHVIDYLETRPDFDGNVCAMGVSQGGGLSILLAGIDDRVSLLINSNPTMGQHVGYKYDRASGFPAYLSIIDDQNQGNAAVFNSAVNATKYYDAMFHARRFKGASFSLTGLKDLVVPSATALVSHNQLRGSKVLMISKDGGHDHPNEYWNGRFEFMRRHFAGSNNPPFQFGATNKGFLADAGNDQTVGTSANLNGKIFYDNSELNNLDVTWRKVSGPGSVSFSNSGGYNTSANFSSNGTYVLQFVGRDDRKLNNEGKIYFISDDIQVTVTGGGNPTYTLNLSCPSNQSVEIPAGQSQTTVSWSNPSASSNCGGGASSFQLAGPQNGSSFSEGNYTITYRATDNCGNQEDCSFTVNVTQEQDVSSNITLNCPADIVVTASAGDNAMTVSWAEPSASTTCTNGGSTGGGDCSSTFQSGYAYMGTFENSQFYLSNNSANWQDAKTAAEQAGGRLAIINNAGENDFIQQNVNNEIVFIGLSDDGQEGSLRWVDGTSVSYSKFVSGVNNSGDNDYVTLYPWNGEWDLNGQFVSKKYVLEIPCSGGGGGGNGLTVNQTGGGSNGSNFSVGTTTVSYTATDNCGNSASCSFNVTVNASAASLSIDCPSDLSVQIPAGQSSTSVSWAQATASSNCNGGATVTQIGGNGNGNQFTPGNYTITYRATDNCGNEETCSFSVNVTSSPTNLSINCPGNSNVEIPAGQTQTQINWSTPTATTSCPNGATVNQIGGTGNFSQVGVGTYNISYEATDNCGNRETCSFAITVTQSQTALTINCPNNQTIDIPSGQTTVVLNWADPTASTNCSGNANINQIGGTPKFSVVGAGTYNLSYEATDNCGNRETCSFSVTVNQPSVSTNVSIDCPSSQTIQLPQGQTEVALNWTDPTASSNCNGGATINQIGGAPKFSALGIGTYFISYEATDNCGNRDVCDFVVTIEAGAVNGSDISLNCPSNITVEIAANESATNVNWSAPSASTTCTTGGSGGGGDCSSTNISGYSYMGEFQGSQYYKSNGNFNFDLARADANAKGGNIVKITSSEENEFIRQNIGSDLCIIGVNDEESEGTWKWADGSNASYLNFPANLNNNFSADYGVINFWNGEWELTTDFIYKKYILEVPCGGGSGGPSSVNLNQIAGPSNGSSFGVGTTTITYQATDDCGNSETCSFTVTVNQADPIDNNNGRPTAVVSTASTTVSNDFMVSIVFSEPVTGLNEYDLAITNANWYNFTSSNNTNFTIMIDPINAGNVSIQVPQSVAFDSDIQGNEASNTINVNYAPGGGTGPTPPPTNGSCVIVPNSVVLEDGNTVGGAVNNLINGTGLSGGNGLAAEHGGGRLYDGVWLNDGTDVTLRFDLGQAQTVDGVAIWNYSYHTWNVLKRRGARDFQISTSNDGVNYTATTFFTARQTTSRGENEEVQLFNFSSVTARYIRLRILNALDDSFYVGLGEVRFINNCAVNTSRIEDLTTDISEVLPTLSASSAEVDAAVFPNPFSNNFYLDINATAHSSATIQVINEVGAIVYRQKLVLMDNGPLEINIADQAAGMYFVRILVDEEFPILKKIIKTNR